MAKAALYDHCVTVYEKMEFSSQEEEFEGYQGKVYRGHTTRMFSDLELAVPYYTSVMRRLADMDCIKQLRRGGGNAMSVWALLRPPTRELFDTAENATPRPTASRKQSTSDILRQQIRSLDARLKQVEQKCELLQAVVLGAEGERDAG